MVILKVIGAKRDTYDYLNCNVIVREIFEEKKY